MRYIWYEETSVNVGLRDLGIIGLKLSTTEQEKLIVSCLHCQRSGSGCQYVGKGLNLVLISELNSAATAFRRLTLLWKFHSLKILRW